MLSSDAAGVEPASGESEGEPMWAAVAAPFGDEAGGNGAIYGGFSPPVAVPRRHLVRTAESYGHLADLCMSEDLSLAAVLCSPGFDALTGCLSYGGLIEVVETELERSRRNEHRLSCCFLDLDGFKRVNDERGHLEGNRVLTAVGDAIRRTARSYDAVGRFGGDEFIVVFPETGVRGAHSVATRMRAAALEDIAKATTVPLDASVGVAEWNGTCSAMEFLDIADRALREAKAAGGARVIEGPAHRRGNGLMELTKTLVGPWREENHGSARPRGD